MSEIILSKKSGFCFGVQRAVDEALKIRELTDKNVYTLGPLIHNNDVINLLNSKNIKAISEEEIEELTEKDIIIIRSHGVPKEIYNKLDSKNIEIFDMTCPYVKNIQKKVEKYYNNGYKILIVGDPVHPEVIGINGWCENSAIICKNGECNTGLPSKLCIVAQTTEKIENWSKVLQVVSLECKEFLAFNTICIATEERQNNAMELSKNVDAMIVIGGTESSNSKKLYEICSSNCADSIFVERAEDIPKEFVIKHSKNKIGVAAGASTPDWIIKEAIEIMEKDTAVNFNEQMAYMEANDKQIYVGQLVSGRIISLSEKEIMVDIGYKSEGVIPSEEFIEEEKNSINEFYKIGDIIDSKVISRINEDGYVVLSRVEILREAALAEIEKSFVDKSLLDLFIKEAINGGVLAIYKGVRVFIPASQLDLNHVDDLKKFVNKKISVRIIEFNNDRNRTKIVASRKVVLAEEKKLVEDALWNNIQLGDVIEGEIKRLSPFGAFIDLGGVDGLLHISELSWGRVNKPEELLKIGEKITVKIIGLDREKNKISLSLKALQNDPWQGGEEKYPIGNIVLGKVVRFAAFGAFVELEPGIDGLVHISQIAHKKIEKPEEVLKIGEQIKAKILEVNTESKRISLSIKAVE